MDESRSRAIGLAEAGSGGADAGEGGLFGRLVALADSIRIGHHDSGQDESAHDATVAALLVDAGADIVVRSSCDDDGNQGCAAAVSAGTCDLALGAESLGEARVAAADAGVIGVRPTLGSISGHGIRQSAPSQHSVVLMARTASAAAVLTRSLVGHDPADPYSLQPAGLIATARLGQPLAGLRVGVPETYFFDDLDDGVAGCVEEFMQVMRTAGVFLVPVADFGQRWAVQELGLIVDCEAAAGELNPDSAPRGAGVSDGHVVEGVELARALDRRMRFRRRLATVLEDVHVLVAPSVGGHPKGDLAAPWAGHAGPSLTLPIGRLENGLLENGQLAKGQVVGMTVAAAAWEEQVLFQFADAYQRETSTSEPASTSKPALPSPARVR